MHVRSSRRISAATSERAPRRPSTDTRRLPSSSSPGVDDLRESGGADAVADALDALIRRAQRAARRHGVTFHYTDVVPGGGKILMTGGLPAVRGDDEERLLRAAVDSVTRYRGPLTVRAGLNSGRFFAHDVGTAARRVYSFSGDSVNLAARVMSHAPYGQVLATDTFLAHVRPEVRAEPVPPFPVKGKTDPVNVSVVTRVGSRSADISYSAGPFVGRAGELELLLHAATSAAAGAGQVVDIVAEPGLGKSRLVTEAAADGRSRPGDPSRRPSVTPRRTSRSATWCERCSTSSPTRTRRRSLVRSTTLSRRALRDSSIGFHCWARCSTSRRRRRPRWTASTAAIDGSASRSRRSRSSRLS